MTPLAKQVPCFLALKTAIAYECMKITFDSRRDEMELLTELFRVDEAVPASRDASLPALMVADWPANDQSSGYRLSP